MRKLAHRISTYRLCRLHMPKGYGNLRSGNASLERRPVRLARNRPTPLSWTSLASHKTTFPFNASVAAYAFDADLAKPFLNNSQSAFFGTSARGLHSARPG